MIQFSQRKEQNDWLEQELQSLKTGYLKQKMSDEQAAAFRAKVKEAGAQLRREQRKAGFARYAAAAAAVLGLFIILPNTSAAAADAMEQIPVLGHLAQALTFRNYEYVSDRNMADIEVPAIQPDSQGGDTKAGRTLQRTAGEINAEIQKITDELVREFEENLEHDYGYQDVIVSSEVLAETEDSFTLKLNCYQGAGSGYAWNYYYTIDLNTGERLKLRDLFQDNADYVTPISENIRQQMQEQMAQDENVTYWLDSDIEEWNFKTISKDASFYLNAAGNVVIGFNEGDVAPMYMGTVEFEIPADVLKDIRR